VRESVRRLHLIAGLAILACAPAAGTSETSGDLRTSRSSSLLSAEEIRAANVDIGSALEAISRLRPNWLTRGTTSFDPPRTEYPVVFVDGVRYGELESLRNIAADHVAAVRFYSAAEAAPRFGLQGGLSGVIEINMKK
jgi:hypothetical protein